MARAHQYPRLILAVVCLPVFIGALDLTIVSAVLPEVIRSMTVEIQKLDIAGWVVTGYFVSYAVSMTFMGKVSDISGRRVVFLSCLVIFFVGSWLVAASPGWPATDRIADHARLPRGGPRSSVRRALCLDLRPRHPGVRRRRDGASEHGAGRRSLSSRETRAPARDRRRSRYGGLGARASVRRDHGAVHDLALPLLDQPSHHRRDVCRDVVGTGRVASHGHRRAASTGLASRFSVPPLFCSMSASVHRSSPPSSRPPRRRISCTGSSGRQWSS